MQAPQAWDDANRGWICIGDGGELGEKCGPTWTCAVQVPPSITTGSWKSG
ncbi:MAG TPA: hypothetical protein VKK79_10855 [Candidatus Lokiarchaeia archaeon]|nr:hypothetical protein [Candidatus Lokiarchaeia archaeon]